MSRPKAERPAEGWSAEDTEYDYEPKGFRWMIHGPGLYTEDGFVAYSRPEYRTKEAAIRATHLWAAFVPASEALRDYNREWALDQDEAE